MNRDQAVFGLRIPNDHRFLGITFHQQALVFDLAANLLGAVMSDAATAVVGR